MARKQTPLGTDEQAALRALIASVGAPEASRQLGLPASTIARAAAGFGTSIGTKLVLVSALSRR